MSTKRNRSVWPWAVHRQERWLVALIAVLIGLRYLCALFYLGKPIPASYHPGNEAVVTSAAILRYQYGFNALQVVAPLEGRVELRLHSWLTVPLLAVGYTEGGRLVSWLASLFSVVTVFLIGRSLWGERVGAVGALLLTVSPTFTLFSYHILPENLSVLLTCLAVLVAMGSDSLTWQRSLLLVIVFSLATLNHIWEVTILLPLLVLLRKRRARGLVVSLLGLGALLSTVNIFVFGTNYFRVSVGQQHHIQQYSFLHNAELFLSPNWWLPLDRWRSFSLVTSVYFLLALGSTLYLTWPLFRKTGGSNSALLASWFIAGLTPIFLLPRHYVAHDYSIWGILTPVSLGLAFIGDRVFKRLGNRVVVSVLVGVTILSAAFLFLAERRLRDQPYPVAEKLAIREAGLGLSQYVEEHSTQPAEVAILVEPAASSDVARGYFAERLRLSQLLMYGRLIPVYWDGMSQAVVDNVLGRQFPAPDVVDDLKELPAGNSILISTQMALSRHPGWEDSYRELLDVADVVVLVKK